jgi:hypothetical protein
MTVKIVVPTDGNFDSIRTAWGAGEDVGAEGADEFIVDRKGEAK